MVGLISVEQRVVHILPPPMIMMLLLMNMVNKISIHIYFNLFNLFINLLIFWHFLKGNLNQPKWGHLKQLHEVLKCIEFTLTHGDVNNTDFGNSVTVSNY